MCSLPKSKVAAGLTSETKVLNVIQCCSNSPVMGGKYQTASKFCLDHIDHDSNVRQVVLPPHYEYFRSKLDEVTLPDTEDSSLLVGCRKTRKLLIVFMTGLLVFWP